MKRFALLAGDTYYPQPGWNGFDSWHDTAEEAVSQGEEIVSEWGKWYQVLDTHDFKIVAGNGEAHTGLFGKVSCAVTPKHYSFSDNGTDSKELEWEVATRDQIFESIAKTAIHCPDCVFTIVEV